MWRRMGISQKLTGFARRLPLGELVRYFWPALRIFVDIDREGVVINDEVPMVVAWSQDINDEPPMMVAINGVLNDEGPMIVAVGAILNDEVSGT